MNSARKTLKHQARMLVISASLFSVIARGETLPQNATFTPPQPAQPTDTQDRSDKNGSASAMAAMGAAVAGMSCVMLMRQAQKETDPSMKRLLMMQAMQQCSQAAQNAASADKNNDNKNQLSFDDSAQAQNQLQTQPFQAPSNNFDDNARIGLGDNAGPSAVVQNSSSDEKGRKDKAAPNTQGGEVSNGDGIGLEAPPEALKVIPPAKVGYDEQAGNNGTIANVGTNPNLNRQTTGAPAFPESDKKTVALEPNQAPRNGRAKSKSDEEEGTGSGSSSDDSKKGDDSFDSMMANLFGGPKEAVFDASVFGSDADILSLGKPGDEKTLNIFQYASVRFRQAAREDKRIRVRPATERTPLRSTASIGIN